MRQFLLLGLWLIPTAAWVQQSSAPGAANASLQVSTNQDISNTPLKTADGVAACAVELRSSSVPGGAYRVGGGVLPPKPIETPEAAFSDEARQFGRKFMKDQHVKQFEAMSMIRLTVDVNGMPQEVCVAREAGHGLDRKAAEAVTKYRFQPATLDGNPVPVRLTVEIGFKLY